MYLTVELQNERAWLMALLRLLLADRFRHKYVPLTSSLDSQLSPHKSATIKQASNKNGLLHRTFDSFSIYHYYE